MAVAKKKPAGKGFVPFGKKVDPKAAAAAKKKAAAKKPMPKKK